jgi:hypothetical protein
LLIMPSSDSAFRSTVEHAVLTFAHWRSPTFQRLTRCELVGFSIKRFIEINEAAIGSPR